MFDEAGGSGIEVIDDLLSMFVPSEFSGFTAAVSDIAPATDDKRRKWNEKHLTREKSALETRCVVVTRQTP